MENRLRNYFPLIRERKEVLKEIDESSGLQALFRSWAPEQQEEFLDFCTGMKGVKILYDSFFKEIMSPEYTPGRLNHFLSLLLRQYKRARDKRNREKGKFSYKDIKNVYVIVLFEKSPVEFHSMEKEYLHKSDWSFDTGLELDLLQNIIFITLDIFQKNMENKSIENELEAWLMFYSTQDPERIIELINKYPMFRQMYGDVYEVCRNMEKVMGMFSEELREMDRNTVQYMIDEMQATIDAQSAALEEEKKKYEEEIKRYEEEQKRHEEEQKRHDEENNKLLEMITAQAAALEKALKRIEELERKNGSDSIK